MGWNSGENIPEDFLSARMWLLVVWKKFTHVSGEYWRWWLLRNLVGFLSGIMLSYPRKRQSHSHCFGNLKSREMVLIEPYSWYLFTFCARSRVLSSNQEMLLTLFSALLRTGLAFSACLSKRIGELHWPASDAGMKWAGERRNNGLAARIVLDHFQKHCRINISTFHYLLNSGAKWI